MVHGHGGVGVDVIAVMHIVLRKPHRRRQLREHHPQNIRVGQQNLPRPRAAEQFAQLHKHPLDRNFLEQRRISPGGGVRLRVQLEPQHRSKPNRPQDAQGVLLKPPVRLPHRADDPGRQIRLPAEKILQAFAGGVGHGVDGKVPPGRVLPQAAGKGHPVRVAGVGIAAVHAIGRDLQRHALQQHRHRPVLQARLDAPLPGKDGLRLLRQGRGREVIVRGRAAQ